MTFRDIAAFVWLAVVLAVVYGGLPELVRALSPTERRGARTPLVASLVATVAIGVEALSLAALINSVSVVALHLAWAVTAIFWLNRTFDRRPPTASRRGQVDGGARRARLPALCRAALTRAAAPCAGRRIRIGRPSS